MNEKIPDILGKQISFTDDLGKRKYATIQQSFGLHGGKSFIFLALRDEKPEQLIVKYPKPGDSITDEFEILEKIHATDFAENLPKCWISDLNGIPILVMEFLQKSRQWQTLKLEQQITNVEILKSLLQAIKLIDISHKSGIINTDLKIENCYWMEGDRFVLLDWNKFEKISRNPDKVEKEKIENLKRQNYIDILYFAYYMLTGEKPTNPLPELNCPEPQAWRNSPYVIRRTIHDLKKGELLSINELESRFGILLDLLEKVEKKDWQALILEAESSIHNGEISLSHSMKIEDILSVLPSDLPEDYKNQILEIRDRLNDKKRSQTQLIRIAEQEMVEFIRDRKPSAAMKTGEQAIQRINLPDNKKWRIVKILSIAKCMNDSIGESIYVNQEDAKIIADSIDKPQLSSRLSDGEFSERIDKTLKILTTCDSWIMKLIETKGDDYSELLKNYQELHEWIEKAIEIKKYPDEFHSIFYSNFPNWDLDDLRTCEVSKTRIKRQAAMQNEFLDEINTHLIRAGFNGYPADEITNILINAPDEVHQTSYFSCMGEINGLIESQNWIDLLILIGEKKKILGIELTNNLVRAIKSSIDAWLLGKTDTKLYAPELLIISQVIEISKKNGLDLSGKNFFEEKIKAYLNVRMDDSVSLKKCEELGLEPWMKNSSELDFSVENLLTLNEKKEYQKNLDSLRGYFSGINEKNENNVIKIREMADEEERKVKELYDQCEKTAQLVENTQEKINNLSKESESEIKKSLDKIYKGFVSERTENPEWWEMFLSGNLIRLESEIRSRRNTSSKVDIAKLDEWTFRIRLVRDLTEIIRIVNNTKKPSSELMGKEALLKIVIPEMYWDVAGKIIEMEKAQENPRRIAEPPIFENKPLNREKKNRFHLGGKK